jgi:phosphatidylserine synthase
MRMDANSTTSTTPKPRRGIYLLPNLFTTGALFAGFYAIIAAISLHFTDAVIAVFVAGVLDGLDGRVARLTNTQSEFGVQYDSLSDLVSFGVAPALVLYVWSLSTLKEYGPAWGKVAGLLMVSRFRYFSFKTFPKSDRVPFFWILLAVLIIVALAIYPERVLFAIAFLYALSGPVLTLWTLRQRRGQRELVAPPSGDPPPP